MKRIKNVKEEYPFGLNNGDWIAVQLNVENQIIANQQAFAKIRAQKKQSSKSTNISF